MKLTECLSSSYAKGTVALEKFGSTEQRVPMRQTCLITLQIGSPWLRSCRAPSTYSPTPVQTLGGLEMRRASPEPRAGPQLIGPRYQSETQALSSKCHD